MTSRRPVVMSAGYRTELPSGDTVAASLIDVTPSGNLAATNAASAFNELQSDIDTRATASALTAHTGASTGVHGVTGSVVGTSDTQTLTNKTLTTPTIASIVNTGTLTLPTSTDTLVGRATTDTLTNKTLSSPTLSGTVGGTFTIGGTPTFPSTVVLTTGAQTLASKTLTAPIISTISNTGTLTLPTATDTLVGRNTTDTLTNKQLTNPKITGITKGDLLAGISTDQAAIFSAGSLGRLLMADPSQTAGMQWSSVPMRGFIRGLLPSNNATDSTNDLDISAGAAWDNTNDVLLVLSSGITKRLDAAWSVGTNQGGLDTGTMAADTGYYVWLIRRPDTGVVDVLLSTSATSPTMPTNYTQKVRISWIATNPSTAIRPFKYAQGWMFWNTLVKRLDTTTLGTTEVDFAMLCPTGIGKILVMYRANATHLSVGTQVAVRDNDETDAAPSLTTGPSTTAVIQQMGTAIAWEGLIMTDAVGKLAARSSAASTTCVVSTKAWYDPIRNQGDYS